MVIVCTAVLAYFTEKLESDLIMVVVRISDYYSWMIESFCKQKKHAFETNFKSINPSELSYNTEYAVAWKRNYSFFFLIFNWALFIFFLRKMNAPTPENRAGREVRGGATAVSYAPNCRMQASHALIDPCFISPLKRSTALPVWPQSHVIPNW